MKAVLQMFWRICLLRQSPGHVPTQAWFVVAVVVANLLTSVIVSLSLNLDVSPIAVVTRVVVTLATTAALVWLATYLREFPTRFLGTLTALFGCDLILSAIFGILSPIAAQLGDQALSFLWLVYTIWSLTVSGFILAQALSVRVGIGVLIALGIAILSVATSQTAIGG
ncbi:MAG: hypothetical protein P8Y69_07405 [Gammaproteobacteria bacterium]